MNRLKEGAVWRNCPMWEVIKFRNLEECECATVAECCRVLPPLPPFRVLLGYAVITLSRNSKEGQSDLTDVTRNVPPTSDTKCDVYATNKTGSSSDDWIYYQMVTHSLINYTYTMAIQFYLSCTRFTVHRCTRTRNLLFH
jgi:hypothetical protein